MEQNEMEGKKYSSLVGSNLCNCSVKFRRNCEDLFHLYFNNICIKYNTNKRTGPNCSKGG